jgi:hypothetical protein
VGDVLKCEMCELEVRHGGLTFVPDFEVYVCGDCMGATACAVCNVPMKAGQGECKRCEHALCAACGPLCEDCADAAVMEENIPW